MGRGTFRGGKPVGDVGGDEREAARSRGCRVGDVEGNVEVAGDVRGLIRRCSRCDGVSQPTPNFTSRTTPTAVYYGATIHAGIASGGVGGLRFGHEEITPVGDCVLMRVALWGRGKAAASKAP